MKKYTLAIQSNIICKDNIQFKFVFKNILAHTLQAGAPDREFTEGNELCAEFMGQLMVRVDTAQDFSMTAAFYRSKYDRNANLLIGLEVYDDIAFPYLCSRMCNASCDDITLTDEMGAVFLIHDHEVIFGDIPHELKKSFEKNLESAGVTTKSIFPEFDAHMYMSDAIEYAEAHFEEFLAAREKASKITYTTLAYELGIACPSLVKHRVVGGHKRGRVIKTTPKEGDTYCIIGYDGSDKPLFITHVNSFGTRNTEFFFDFNGYTWAMELHESESPEYNGKHRYGNVYKFRYDSKGRIEFYAAIDRVSLHCEKYEYPQGEDIICHYYYYVPNRAGTNRNIPAGQPNSPMYEYRYEISPDRKRIREYDKQDDDFVFSREIVSSGKISKNPKPASDSYEKFAAWLDKVLTDDIPEKGGVYFDICEPFEDGFSFAFEICEGYDKEDDEWACSPIYSTDFFMISTDGQLEWEKVLKHTAAFIRKYLREGENRAVLKKYDGIGTGFADGDILYIK